MKQEILKVRQQDNTYTSVAHYLTDNTSKATLLLLHGMAEHYERYESFISYLISNNIDVYTYSHRGHGLDCPKENLGWFADTGGDQLVVNDAITILKHIYENDPKKPLFLMGHSMGSIITRNVIQQFDSLAGVIICGTSNPRTFMSRFGLFYMNMIQYKRRLHKRSKHMDKMLFQTRTFTKMNQITEFDWINSIDSEVTKYINDPYCGFLCTNSFYHDLISLTLHASLPSRMLKTKKDLPFFILSGEDDPVGGYGKDVMRLVSFYQNHGYHVTSKLYSQCRHEILLDRKKESVMNDVFDFITTNIN